MKLKSTSSETFNCEKTDKPNERFVFGSIIGAQVNIIDDFVYDRKCDVERRNVCSLIGDASNATVKISNNLTKSTKLSVLVRLKSSPRGRFLRYHRAKCNSQ